MRDTTQYTICTSQGITWIPAADEEHARELVQRAADCAGRSVMAIEADLAAGRVVPLGTDWYRCGSFGLRRVDAAAEAARQAELDRRVDAAYERERRETRRFTCRVCGEHRDTTVRGHCDDCE